MTRILWINPVGTTKFDEPIANELARIKNDETEVAVRALSAGPQQLEYHASEVMAAPGILQTVVDAEAQGFDAAIIGCFFDTALSAAREVTSTMPVVGPCEAAVSIAARLGSRFSVITGRRNWVPHMTDNIVRYGFEDHLASFRLVDLGVHDFHDRRDETRDRIRAACIEAITEDEAEVCVLGCTIEYGLFQDLQEEIGAPVVDATAAPLKHAEHLAQLASLGWLPSKVGLYQGPSAEELESFGLRLPKESRIR